MYEVRRVYLDNQPKVAIVRQYRTRAQAIYFTDSGVVVRFLPIEAIGGAVYLNRKSGPVPYPLKRARRKMLRAMAGVTPGARRALREVTA